MSLLERLICKRLIFKRTFEDFHIEGYKYIFGETKHIATSEKRNMVMEYYDQFGCNEWMIYQFVHVIREQDMELNNHTIADYERKLADERIMRLERDPRAMKYEDASNMEFALQHCKPLRSR